MSQAMVYEYTCDGCGAVVRVPTKWEIDDDEDEEKEDDGTTPTLKGWVTLYIRDEANYRNKVDLLACPACAGDLLTMFKAAMERLEAGRQQGTNPGEPEGS
jgi:hypothetical protein